MENSIEAPPEGKTEQPYGTQFHLKKKKRNGSNDYLI